MAPAWDILKVLGEFFAAYALLSFSARVHHAAARSHVVWHDLQRSEIESPFAAQPSCAVPDKLHSLERMRARVGFEEPPEPERWCLPQLKAAQDREARNLERLHEFLRSEAKARGYMGLHARHVGAPLRALYWKGLLLLNPRIRNERDPSTCDVRRPLTPGTVDRIAYYKGFDVWFMTDAGHERNMSVAGDEACVMTALF